MTDSFKWRSATPADLPQIVALFNAANAVDSPVLVVGVDDVKKLMATDDLASNTRLVTDSSGEVVGFASLLEPAPTPLALEVESAGVVAPSARGAGLGSELVAWQEARAREMVAATSSAAAASTAAASPIAAAPTAEPTLRPWLATDVGHGANATLDLLEANGYVNKRSWIRMVRDLSVPILEPKFPADVRVASPEGLSAETHEAYNDAFQDHWGSRADTREEWLAREVRADYRPDLSFVTVSDRSDGAREVGGLVITRVNPAQFEAHGGSFAYIHLMGVRRSWRGRGIASALIAHSLREFAAAGFENAELYVDADSLTGAVHVYEKLGFREADRRSTYVKEL